MDSQNIRRELEVGVVPTQDLGYHQPAVHNNKFTRTETYFIDYKYRLASQRR